MNLLSLAWKNLWRNRRRTLITLIALSFSLMLLQGSHNLSHGVYSSMIDSGVRAGSGHMVIYQRHYLDSRDEKLTFAPTDLTAEIAALPKVEAVLPRLYLPGLAQSSRESRGILLTGVDPSVEKMLNPFLRKLPASEWFSASDGHEAILGSRLLKELKLKPGQKFVVTMQHQSGELVSDMFRVRGVVATGIKTVDSTLMMVGLDRAAALVGVKGKVHELAIILMDQNAEPQVWPQVKMLLQKRPDIATYSWEEAMPNLYNAIRLDYASSNFIFVILLLIVAIGVVNTLLMSVMERFREFGVILAVGARTVRLRLLILTEALLMGLVAMIVGSCLGALLTWYLVAVGIDMRTFVSETLEFGGVVFDPVLRAAWDLPWMLRISFYLLVLSFLAALYPAIKAGRICPVAAMRHY
ncbi:MAG: ABC transporter permease [Desulfuromonadales bacterium]|nr:ABC transporter permease [Desulfuromonadales bacterium]MBN2791092.1 ABC transporter permease [Desulfuromonadales bacterium]